MKNLTLYATLILVLAATACQVLPVGSDGITDKTRNLAPSGRAYLYNGDHLARVKHFCRFTPSAWPRC